MLDTNVLVAAMRSPRGASAHLLRAALNGRVELACTIGLFLEYEQTLKRPLHLEAAGWTIRDVDGLLGSLAPLLVPAPPAYSNRPRLDDPDDEVVWEAAETANVDALVTFEIRTFRAIGLAYGIAIMTPAQFVARLLP